MSELAVTIVADTLVGKCWTCGERIQRPNKGLGRADVAAWRTRHQHVSAGGENWNPTTATPGCDWFGECEWCEWCDNLGRTSPLSP